MLLFPLLSSKVEANLSKQENSSLIKTIPKLAHRYEWRGLDGLEERLEALKNEPTSGPSKDEEEGRKERAMARLTQRFSQLLMQSPDGAIELEDAAVKLLGPSAEGEKSKSKVRRLYDIANIMCALGLIAKANMDKAKTWFRWLGPADVGSSIKAAALSDSVKELTSHEAAMASLSPEMVQMMNMSLMFQLPFPMNESFGNPPGLVKSNLPVPGVGLPGAPADEVAGTGTGTEAGLGSGIGTSMGVGAGGPKKRELNEAGPSSTGEGAEGDGHERPAKRAEVDGTGKQLADLPPLAPLWTAPFPLLWNPGMVSGDGTGPSMDPASASAAMSAAASAAAMMPPPMASVLTQTGQWGPGISAPTMSSQPGSNQMDSNAMPSQLDLTYFQQAYANFYASFLTKPGSEQPPGQEDIPYGNPEAKDDKRSVEPEAAEIKETETETEAQPHANENPMGQSS